MMAVPTSNVLITNATVSSVTRARVPMWDAHRVALSTPSSPMERVTPEGNVVDRILLDGITATYNLNDIVTLLEEDGVPTPADPPRFVVRGISPVPGLLPYVSVQLSASRAQGA